MDIDFDVIGAEYCEREGIKLEKPNANIRHVVACILVGHVYF